MNELIFRAIFINVEFEVKTNYDKNADYLGN